MAECCKAILQWLNNDDNNKKKLSFVKEIVTKLEVINVNWKEANNIWMEWRPLVLQMCHIASDKRISEHKYLIKKKIEQWNLNEDKDSRVVISIDFSPRIEYNATLKGYWLKKNF